ncbi:hypothetical protein O181_000768 [Austropuccinia psidii MF-1]|uniref:Reverse transcriptase Ty1/copia-type domain-containing protein n=1 Tax=Austropuccinia psidii MF-1 TaxID=1389203 RepID=A0A9Q3B9G1_9BASI|nr:hypothetical protein [Austropuccinia psidii MF-1]
MYAPTASLMSLHLVLATVVSKPWLVAPFDVSGTYLYSPVNDNFLVEPPIAFMPELRGKALCLKKALYGMQQAGRCWWKLLTGILSRLGFVATEVDQFLYVLQSEMAFMAIWIHIVDFVVTSNSPEAVSNFRNALYAELGIKWSDVM